MDIKFCPSWSNFFLSQNWIFFKYFVDDTNIIYTLRFQRAIYGFFAAF